MPVLQMPTFTIFTDSLLQKYDHFLNFFIQFRKFEKMGLQNALVNALLNPKRSIRILIRTLVLILRAMCHLSNSNARHDIFGIPQPRYYNSMADIDLGRTFFSILWVNDLSSRLQEDQKFKEKMRDHDYDSIVKAYFPTKMTALQSVNIKNTWKYSYFNPKNSEKANRHQFIYPQSDILFADMMTNTQGIYKLKKVIPGTQPHDKCKIFFEDLLQQNKDKVISGKGNNVLETLMKEQKLFYLDYPELRANENKKKMNRYTNELTSTSGNSYQAYLEIPFAIFGLIKAGESQKLICLGAIFNDTYDKKDKNDIQPYELYHPFSSEQFDRDRFQMAKCHMACTDTNDFTIRMHLGVLHYASSIYTTAFCNLAREYPEMNWVKEFFIDIFSQGLLQIDFMANLTLIDDVDPLAEKIFYLKQAESVKIILEQNTNFNIMQFNPEYLAKDSYESDAVKMSRLYYQKLKKFIDYLFWFYHDALNGKTAEYGRFLYDQLGDQKDRFDAVPITICEDHTTESLKTMMTNLAYLWVVHHGETFSLVSVANSFYLVPPMMRKPLSSLRSSYHLTEKDKQQWLPPPDVIKDSMTLHKVVTYRDEKDSLVSAWQEINISNDSWKQFQRVGGELGCPMDQKNCSIDFNQTEQRIIAVKSKDYTQEKQSGQLEITKFQDFWNNLTLDIYEMNYLRTKKGLYNIHWLLPHQLAISLNI